MADELSDHDLLVRVDERLTSLQNELAVRMIERSKEVDDLWRTFTLHVTRVEFTPVKILVYGMVGLILSSVVAALISFVISA
jgi:hypothetical protein